MFPVMLSLAIFSLIALIIGFIWIMITTGQSHESSGPEVGEEIMAGHLDDGLEMPLAKKIAFKGQAYKREREVSISFKEIKEQVLLKHWSQIMPVLLAIGGFFGLLAFGSLALFFALEDKLVGGLIAALTLFTLLRILIRLIRA